MHRPRYDDWSLPKGKAHPGESLAAAARREAVEETGYDVALGRWLGRTSYPLDGDEQKVVDYWVGRVGARNGALPEDEVDDVAWLSPDAARERLTWARDRELVERMAYAPVDTATVLLVRHARAGSRDAWPGPDDDRPLDPTGRAQVDALRRTLPAFWLPAEMPRVVAAPPVRCVETVSWIGPVDVEPALSEAAYAADPEAVVACVRSLATAGVAVACSQGGTIPAVIEELRRRDGLRPAAVRAAKGSTWVLSFADGRLVAADYLDAA